MHRASPIVAEVLFVAVLLLAWLARAGMAGSLFDSAADTGRALGIVLG